MKKDMLKPNESKASTLFPCRGSLNGTFDVAPLFEVIDNYTSPMGAVKILENCHQHLLEVFLHGEYCELYAANTLYLIKLLRDAILKGAAGLDIETGEIVRVPESQHYNKEVIVS